MWIVNFDINKIDLNWIPILHFDIWENNNHNTFFHLFYWLSTACDTHKASAWACWGLVEPPFKSNHKMPTSFATSVCPPSPSPWLCLQVCIWIRGLGRRGPERSATWTRLMSLSRHTDLCCNTHDRHHKLSHQFSPIGCGMSWLTQFVEKCTCLCLASL